MRKQLREQSNVELTNEGTDALHHLVSHWSILESNVANVGQATCKARYFRNTPHNVDANFNNHQLSRSRSTCVRVWPGVSL